MTLAGIAGAVSISRGPCRFPLARDRKEDYHWVMNKTPTATETEIATYARRTAKAARKLRAAGDHEAANALVRAAAEKAAWYRAHRAAGGAV